MATPHVVLLFLDGVGIGKKDSKINPFFVAQLPTFKNLLGGRMMHLRDAHRETGSMSLIPLNATLRVPGLPQSGTGQTALLTGINAPRVAGRHFGPYPFSTLKPVLTFNNIFHTLTLRGNAVFFANAFPKKYFDYINSAGARIPAIAYSYLSSGKSLNGHDELKSGHALSADITSERWNMAGFPSVSAISPKVAGYRIVEIAHTYDFVLFEFSQTDHAGHAQSFSEAVSVLELIDSFIEGILEKLDLNSDLLLITSDHGNIEDLSVKTHTRNPVPLIAIGKQHRTITKHARSLTHVAPAIMSLLE